MGILDNKSRIVDTVITFEGRRQLSTGKMKVEYYTFTDGDMFYQSSSSGVTDDASQRFYFESQPYLPADQITPETDQTGLIKSFTPIDSTQIYYGQVLTSSVLTGTIANFVTSSAFVSSSIDALSSVINNFASLYAIRSVNRLFDDNTFDPAETKVLFDKKIVTSNAPPLDISNTANFALDQKTSNVANFMFLPPIKKLGPSEAYDPNKKYDYVGDEVKSYSEIKLNNDLSNKKKLTLDAVKNGFNQFDNGYHYLGTNYTARNGLSKSIKFDGNILNRKVAFQVFEIDDSNKVTKKLDVLDVGNLDGQRVVFVGKNIEKNVGPDVGHSVFAQIFVLLIK